jgi:aminoglycoside 6'-N-acetyltransferase
MTAADLPLVQRWLNTPHVAQWWGDPVQGLAQIAQHIGDRAVDVFIVILDDIPIGYLQSWDPHAEVDHPCRDQPQGTRGIDQFIGEPDLIGRGHGSAFIRAFVERLFAAGAPRVITDPNPRNARAICAYGKAGFRPIDNRVTISGEALLMGCDARTMTA